MSDHNAGHSGKTFITIIIAVIIALVLSPLIFSSIKSANNTGQITGTLATIVNLVPLFYYLAVALVVVGDVYVFLRVYRQSTDLKSSPVRGILKALKARVLYRGLRPLGA